MGDARWEEILHDPDFFKQVNGPLFADSSAWYVPGSQRRMTKYQTDELTVLAIDYVEHYDREEPLYLVLSVEPPHLPLEAPKEDQRFDPATLARRADFFDTPEMRAQWAMYYAMIENLDANLGRLLAAREKKEDFSGNT